MYMYVYYIMYIKYVYVVFNVAPKYILYFSVWPKGGLGENALFLLSKKV